MIYLLLQLGGAAPSEDLVTGLNVPYNKSWYSGYLNAGEGKSFHYVFMQSQKTPAKDPIVIWLNGGPGCSSLDGLLYEHGPFLFSPMSDSFKVNNFSWNKLANVLYIESPGSVGFSKGPALSDDQNTSKDNLQALLSFLQKFPQLKSNDIYITGESYAGVYVPFFALRIDEYNNQSNTKIGLKGWMAGNACTHPSECYHPPEDGSSLFTYQFLYRHAYYSAKDYQPFQFACKSNYSSALCKQQRDKLDDKFEEARTSIYNLYNPCYNDSNLSSVGRLLRYSRKVKNNLMSLPCESEGAAIRWLNQEAVKAALHVDSNIKWDICNDEVNANYKKYNQQSYWIYKKLHGKYRIWVYSGDVDAAVPLTGTKFWTDLLQQELKLAEQKAWREWYLPGAKNGENQVAGMVWQLKGFTLATIKGAGHMVPQDKPQAAYILLQSFLAGTSLPK